MATIEEVAERAGVSIASVSRTLNGKTGVGKATRNRILKICEELNYEPSSAARRLSSGRQAVVALVLNQADTPFSPFVSSLQQNLFINLQRKGLVPEVVAYEDVERVPDMATSALVIAKEPNDARAKHLADLGIAVVTIGKESSGFWLAPDDFRGARDLTQLVIERGWKKPLFIEASDGTPEESNLRAQGFKSACFDNHLTPIVQRFDWAHFQGISATKFFLQEFEALNEFDAYICNSDEVAFGVKAALEINGLSVPDDKAVTGFDDLQGIENNLTTVRQDFRELADNAVEMLMQAREGKAPVKKILQVEVVDRGSA